MTKQFIMQEAPHLIFYEQNFTLASIKYFNFHSALDAHKL